VAVSAGLTQANAISTLKRLEGDGLVSSRLETTAEHRNREKDPGNAFKGPRRQLWKLTADGRAVVNG
jgi:DNA-binding PadR family transcriptional regulator